MKVAIYCRVSTEVQDVDIQEHICVEYCKRMNFEVYKVYKDVVSGKVTSRPAFNELLNEMRLYKFNCVMVTKLDRMGRSLQHLLGLFDEFSKKGVEFISVTQNIDTSTSSGKLQMQIMGAFAEFERNLISERTKEGLKGNLKVGKRGKDKNPRKKRGGLRNKGIYLQNMG
jgi:site-specific DNA recombinase